MTEPLALPAQPRILSFVDADSLEAGLMRLPYLRALRHAFPDGALTWMVGRGPSVFRGELAILARGLIDRVVDSVPLEGGVMGLLGRPLAGEQFDLVIDGQRKLLTAMALKRIAAVHFLSASGDWMLSARRPAGPDAGLTPARGMLQLLELATGQPARAVTPLPLTEDVRAAARALLPRGPSYVGMIPGALDLAHAWPVNEYVNIARILAQNGSVPVFLLGLPEQHWHEPIGAAVPTALFPMQHKSVAHHYCAPHLCIALAERLGATLANDSPLTHMVAAAGTPIVALFGPTDPDRQAPLAARLTVLRAQKWGGADMSLIPAVAVLQAIQQMLFPSGRSRAS